MKSSSRSALKSFDRKNAPPLHCFSAGFGSVTRAPRASLIFWSSAVFWVPAKAPNHARFWSISMLPFSRHFALMTIEGLGKKFEEARRARNLTLDEAARLTKIRLSRLAEIEADDFSQFPSLAYAKGFLQIYGKFLEVDVTPYLDAFETSREVTVDGYSYLQDQPAPKPRRVRTTRAPAVRRQRTGDRSSPFPILIAVGVIIAGFILMRLIMNIQRIAPHQMVGVPQPTGVQSAPPQTQAQVPAARPPAASVAPAPSLAPSTPPPTAV